jgi:hypothetical protein
MTAFILIISPVIRKISDGMKIVFDEKQSVKQIEK